MQSESFFYFLWQVRDYPARNCSTERTINFSFIETENCIYARATINIHCKHGFLVQWRRVIHPKRLVITAIMRLLIFVTLDGKTYTNDFPFSNGFPFTSRLCQRFERLGHPFARNSPFEWLPHLLVRNINPFERLTYAFVRNIKPCKRLGHQFVEDIRPLEWLGHLYSGIPLNFLSNDMYGRRVTLFVKKNSLVGVVI